MSHVAAVDLVIKDLGALKVAAERLGFELREGQTTHQWYGRFMNDWSVERAAVTQGYDTSKFGTCLHALRAKGVTQSQVDQREAYEIGVVARRDGKPGFELLYDVYGVGREIEKLAGVGLTKLKDYYGAAVATKDLKRQGYRVVEQIAADGSITITGRR